MTNPNAPLKKRLLNANASTIAKYIKGRIVASAKKQVERERQGAIDHPVRHRKPDPPEET